MKLPALPVVVVLVVVSGCGGSATARSASLAAACAKASREAGSVYRRRVLPLVGKGYVPVIGPSRAEAATLEAAAAEVAAAERRAAASIRLLSQTSATRSALAHLAENERQLLAMRAPREEIGLDMNFSDLATASGGCRRFSTSTDSWSGI